MKYIIEKIYPETVFRIYFFTFLIIGECFGLLFLFISLFLGWFLIGLLVFLVGIPLLALIIGIFGYIGTYIYSAFAEKFGGIGVELRKDVR